MRDGLAAWNPGVVHMMYYYHEMLTVPARELVDDERDRRSPRPAGPVGGEEHLVGDVVTGLERPGRTELHEEIIEVIKPVVTVTVVKADGDELAGGEQGPETRHPHRIGRLARVQAVVVEVDGNLDDPLFDPTLVEAESPRRAEEPFEVEVGKTVIGHLRRQEGAGRAIPAYLQIEPPHSRELVHSVRRVVVRMETERMAVRGHHDPRLGEQRSDDVVRRADA